MTDATRSRSNAPGAMLAAFRSSGGARERSWRRSVTRGAHGSDVAGKRSRWGGGAPDTPTNIPLHTQLV